MEILYYPEPVLRKKAIPVEDITNRAKDLREKAEQMLQLMYEAAGVGLAANQVGLLERLIVKDETGEGAGEPLGVEGVYASGGPRLQRVVINPQIIHEEGETFEEEGCLSLPGIFGKVSRAKKVVVVAYNLKGERLEVEAEDLPARVWQHEIDHLNGILIIDRMTPASRLAASKRLKELEQMYKERHGESAEVRKGGSKVRTL